MAKLMAAQYPGRCQECGGKFREGETIAHIRRGHQEHETCYKAARGTAEQRRAQAEFNQGVADYETEKFVRQIGGEAAAVAWEYERYMRFGDDY